MINVSVSTHLLIIYKEFQFQQMDRLDMAGDLFRIVKMMSAFWQ